jgi:hypothetical protein
MLSLVKRKTKVNLFSAKSNFTYSVGATFQKHFKTKKALREHLEAG